VEATDLDAPDVTGKMQASRTDLRADGFEPDEALRRKLTDLETRLGQYRRVAVAFSGGVDSSLLLAVARRVLGPGAVAFTAVSPSLAPEELEGARRLARELGVEILEVETREMDDARYRANGPDRCFICKTHLFRKVTDLARQRGIDVVLDGNNHDDAGDYRPGIEAARTLGVLSPLMEVGFTKPEIRALARAMDLPVWSKPASPCLASRIPYFQAVTEEKLDRIGRAERFLREQGFGIVRVRHHGEAARIEVEPDRIADLLRPEMRARVQEALEALGFSSVAVDPDGYRSGNLNRMLSGPGPAAPGASD
jgi:uncharacterized protein